MVERASPVILEIASRPPRPAARTSPAANTLRPRSSSFEPTDSHLCRIAFASIMPTRILPGRYFRNPGALSHLATSRQSKNRFICFGSLPKSPIQRNRSPHARRKIRVTCLAGNSILHPLLPLARFWAAVSLFGLGLDADQTAARPLARRIVAGKLREGARPSRRHDEQPRH